MMEEMKSRCQDPHFTAGLLAMAKQYNVLRSNPSKLLSAFHSFGKSGSLTSERADDWLPAYSCCTQEVRRWLKTAFIFWAPCETAQFKFGSVMKSFQRLVLIKPKGHHMTPA
ncbi:hypothetical protein NQZ68_026487 [Dissostichus eleginoides]|nr:hypothetical protein NQZ68_026487 [Dissostichus eleginoides]